MIRCHLSIVTLLCMLSLSAGCGSGADADYVPLSGTISLNGDQEISGGIVATADPATYGNDELKPPTAHAAIENGRFKFLKNQRPSAGTYIFSFRIVDKSNPANFNTDEPGAFKILYRKTITIPDSGDTNLTVELAEEERVSNK
ncbi:hypothetical protein [Calycomorphotria hydatis]|uniref:Uncharacterized protein n=1 Tax=Calycomorphotria hydatis TaxID=2528027 RepID=A0A517T9V7_9PLAN|nr:hypothetical protein [Calycomorphotria hydatis]QDT65158.1 hypothetical protein V22_24050 [Calycomorphotria hydatis]